MNETLCSRNGNSIFIYIGSSGKHFLVFPLKEWAGLGVETRAFRK
jgi:hypothetical protein